MAGVKKALERLGSMKYALLVAAFGLVLLLWPSGGSGAGARAESEEERLEVLLERIEGVGEAHLLLSDSGAAVVCAGADSDRVRLEICQALQCYTGLGSDRIRIFKLKSN